MKKSKVQSVLGAALVIGAIANMPHKPSQKSENQPQLNTIFKVQDKTTDHSAVSDGSKTEKVSKD